MLYAVKKDTIRHIIFEIIYNIFVSYLSFNRNLSDIIYITINIQGLIISRLGVFNRYIVFQLFYLTYLNYVF